MASTFATGIGKRFCLKKESTLATLPGASGAQEMRHVTFDTDLAMASQQSDEKSTSYQLTETRLGMRKLTATESRAILMGHTLDYLAAVRRPLGFRHRCLAHCQTLVCHPVDRVAFLMGLSRNSST